MLTAEPVQRIAATRALLTTITHRMDQGLSPVGELSLLDHGPRTATVTADTYFVVQVEGPPAAPLVRDLISISNPVWADAEGDGLGF